MHRRKVLRWLLVLVSLTVVGAFCVLTHLRREYGKKLMAQVWPSTTAITVSTISETALRTNALLLLGDSRLAEWGQPPIKNWNVLNASAGGITTAQLNLRTAAALGNARPAVVIIQAGINDLKLLGVRSDLREPVLNSCISNLALVIRECRRAGAQVVVTPVWPPGEVPWLRRIVWGSAIEGGLKELNNRLEQDFANEPGVLVTNLFASASQGLSTRNLARLYRDTLHLKPEMYNRLSKALEEIMPPPGFPLRTTNQWTALP